MAKYRHKPVVIEAEQWFPGKAIDGVIIDHTLPFTAFINLDKLQYGAIKSLDGWYIVMPGDWVITRTDGKKLPCKPDIFDQTYERVEEGIDHD